jgi:hypothetical protein
MDKFFKELRRRNVVRVAGVYAVAGWVLVQIATTLEDSMNLPAWFDGLVVALLIIGLPVALILAWAFELTPDGVVRTEDVPEGQHGRNRPQARLRHHRRHRYPRHRHRDDKIRSGRDGSGLDRGR